MNNKLKAYHKHLELMLNKGAMVTIGHTKAGYYKPVSWGPVPVELAKVNSHYEVLINGTSVELANTVAEAFTRAAEHCRAA